MLNSRSSLPFMSLVDYARVLREWTYRFNDNWEDTIVPIVQKEYPELGDPTKLEAFRR